MSEFEDTLDTGSVGSDRVITEQAKNFLVSTTKWANFLSILGYIGLGFMLLGALGMFLGGAFMQSSARTPMPFNPAFFGIIYLAMVVLYFFPVYYLNQFASKMKAGLHSNNTESITKGFEFLKSHYKFLGIMTIIMIGFYIVSMIITISAGVLMY